MKKPLLLAFALVLCTNTAGADVISDWNTQTAQSGHLGVRLETPSSAWRRVVDIDVRRHIWRGAEFNTPTTSEDLSVNR